MLIELIIGTILFLLLLLVSIKKISEKKSSVFITVLIGIFFGGSLIYLWSWFIYLK